VIDRPDSTDSDVAFRDRAAGPRSDYAPQGTDAGTGWWPTLKRTAKEFQEDNLTDWAAALWSR
jgi:membrane protein